jgi:hypothetical protein
LNTAPSKGMDSSWLYDCCCDCYEYHHTTNEQISVISSTLITLLTTHVPIFPSCDYRGHS